MSHEWVESGVLAEFVPHDEAEREHCGLLESHDRVQVCRRLNGLAVVVAMTDGGMSPPATVSVKSLHRVS